MVAFQLPAPSQDGVGAAKFIAAPGAIMEDGFDGRLPQRAGARKRCASAPARRAPSAKPRPPAHVSPLAVKGRALQQNLDAEAGRHRAVGTAQAIHLLPQQSSPMVGSAVGPRPKRRTAGRDSDASTADMLAHPALPRIRTHADDGPPAGKRQQPGASRDELRALFRAYNLPMPRALPPPPHRASAAGGSQAALRPLSGLPAKGPQPVRAHPAAHPYHQRLRGLLDASSHGAMLGAVAPGPGRRTSVNHDQQRGPSAHQRASKQQAGAAAAAPVAVAGPARHSDAGVAQLPLPLVLGRPLEVNQARSAVLPGGGGQAAGQAGESRSAAPEQHPQQQVVAAADEHEQWDWVYRGPPTPESPYGSDILRAMLDVISPRFEVQRPDGYIPITPSSIASSRYVRSDVWSWSCPSSPAVGLRPAPEGSVDAGAAAAADIGRSPFAAARPSPARPTPRHSSPEPLHKKLLMRAAAAAAAAGGAPSRSRQETRQAPAPAAVLAAGASQDRGRGLTPPGGMGWNPSLRLRAEHSQDHLMPHWAAAGHASSSNHNPGSTGQAPSHTPVKQHWQDQASAAPVLAEQQQQQPSQQQLLGFSPGPTPPHGKSRFYQQQHQYHDQQPPLSREPALVLPQITPRQQIGAAMIQRRVSEGGVPSGGVINHCQPSAGMRKGHSSHMSPMRDLCTPPAALQLPNLPPRGSSAGRFSRAAAMASPVLGLRADGSHPRQLAFVTPSPGGPGSRPRGTPGGCVDLLWEPPPIQPSRALDRHRSGSRTPSPECTMRAERACKLAAAAAARLQQQVSAEPRSRRPSSSPNPVPLVSRIDAAEAGAVLRPQQQNRSCSPAATVSARRALYRPASPSSGAAPWLCSSSRRAGPAGHEAAAVSGLGCEAAVCPRSSPAARAAAAALARAAQQVMAGSADVAQLVGTVGVSPQPLLLGDMFGNVAADFNPTLLPSPLPVGVKGSGTQDMQTRLAATGGSAFSFHMGAAAAATGVVSGDGWPGIATPAMCKAGARPASRQSRHGRRRWALPANSAPSSPRVQLFPVPAGGGDGGSQPVCQPAASSPSFGRCGGGALTPGTPGSHRKRYGSHDSIHRATLHVGSAQPRAAAQGAVPACVGAADVHGPCSSPFSTPRELSSDAGAPGSGSDCGGAPSTGAMVGSSVDSWGTALAAALPPSEHIPPQSGNPLPADTDEGAAQLQKHPSQLGGPARGRSAGRSRFGPLSPAAAPVQGPRVSPVARPGLRGSSPAAMSPLQQHSPGSAAEATPPMSPLRQPQLSPLTAGGAAAVEGVRRNLLASFRSASVGRPSTSPEVAGPSTSGIPPRCPAPRPASSGQPLAAGVCPMPPQPLPRYASAQQANRRRWDRPGSTQPQDLLSRAPPASTAASPSRQARHGDTQCDQEVERLTAAAPSQRAPCLLPFGGFAPQPPLVPRDSMAPRRPSTSGSIRSSKESVAAARGGNAVVSTSTDDDVAAGHMDAHTAHAPLSVTESVHADPRLLGQPQYPQRSILDSPDLGPIKARPSSDGTYLTPRGVSSRPPSSSSRCSSAGASDSSRGRGRGHWSYRRARERALFINGVLNVAASSAGVGEKAAAPGGDA